MLDEFRSSGTLSHQRSSHPTLLGTRFAASPFLSTEDRLALERVALPARSVAAGKDLLRESERAAHIDFAVRRAGHDPELAEQLKALIADPVVAGLLSAASLGALLTLERLTVQGRDAVLRGARVRRKLRALPDPPEVSTVVGVGYRLG